MASVARSRLVKAASVWVAVQDPKKYQDWDSVMAKSVGAANIPFVLHLLQLPKIVLNARNLLAGNKECSLGCWATLAPLLFHQEEGDGGCHHVHSWRHLHLYGSRAACHGGVHAGATIRGHFSRCGS